jgi:hypothetical protein
MRIVFHVCLLAACGVMSSGVALAASHGHRPNAARPAPAGEDAAKSAVTPAGPAAATPSLPTAGSNASDMAAPIDTSITVNQGLRRATAKDSIAKKLNTTFGTPATGQSKSHPQPVHPVGAQVPAPRNAVGAVVQHADPRTTAKPAAATTKAASAPAAQPGVAVTAAAAPAPHDASGTAAPAQRIPGATAAGHGAAALKAVTVSGPSINGTGIKRPDTATAAVVGPAKAVAAAVSGTSFRPKHP